MSPVRNSSQPSGVHREGSSRVDQGRDRRQHRETKPVLKYADYFDVSLDYIFGRTDDPHGMIYNNCVKLGLNNPEMARFVEMCFDPGSAMNERLKATLVQMLSEVDTK